MATQQLRLGTAATNIVADLSLTAGTDYTVQNVSADSLVYFREAAAAPMANHRGHVVRPYHDVVITPPAAGGVWFWTDDAGGAYIVVTDAG